MLSHERRGMKQNFSSYQQPPCRWAGRCDTAHASFTSLFSRTAVLVVLLEMCLCNTSCVLYKWGRLRYRVVVTFLFFSFWHASPFLWQFRNSSFCTLKKIFWRVFMKEKWWWWKRATLLSQLNWRYNVHPSMYTHNKKDLQSFTGKTNGKGVVVKVRNLWLTQCALCLKPCQGGANFNFSICWVVYVYTQVFKAESRDPQGTWGGSKGSPAKREIIYCHYNSIN